MSLSLSLSLSLSKSKFIYIKQDIACVGQFRNSIQSKVHRRVLNPTEGVRFLHYPVAWPCIGASRASLGHSTMFHNSSSTESLTLLTAKVVGTLHEAELTWSSTPKVKT